MAFGTTLANLITVLHFHKTVPILQSYILEPVAVASAIALTYLNHTRTRTSSTVLLIFWPLYTLALAIWIRTVIVKDLGYYRLILALKSATGALGLLSFALECISPDVGKKPGKAHPENPILTANIFSKWVSTHIWVVD